jgi:hypothetical protein
MLRMSETGSRATGSGDENWDDTGASRIDIRPGGETLQNRFVCRHPVNGKQD